LVVCPVLLWLWFFRYKDRWEPEPFSLIIKLILIGGVLAIIFSVIFEYMTDDFLLGDYNISSYIDDKESLNVPFLFVLASIFLAVVVEEVVKYIFLAHKVYYASSFNQIKDGVIYGMSMGLGFAFFENTLYFVNAILDGGGLADLSVLAFARSLGPLFMHIVTVGIVGLYMGKKKFSKTHKNSLIVQGLLIAISIHFVYNSIVVFFESFIPAILIVVAGLIYLLTEIAKNKNRMVWKLVRTKSD
jgi:RsiW-degrading membrane proteinase PrsW (M82 family)